MKQFYLYRLIIVPCISQVTTARGRFVVFYGMLSLLPQRASSTGEHHYNLIIIAA
jgi:hypothetical protein